MADKIEKIVVTRLEVDDRQAKKALGDYTKASSDAEKQTEKSTGAQQEYNSALDGMINHLGVLPAGLSKSLRGLTGMTKGFKGLRAAIIATGIGALVIALGALFSWFNRTQEGQEKLAIGMAALGQVADTLLDAFADLGEAIFDAFDDPKQAISDLWEFLKTNFLNRLKGIPILMSAIGKSIEAAFDLDWDGVKTAGEDVAAAFVQISTGLDSKQQKKFFDGIKKGYDDIKKSVKASTSLQVERNNLERARIDFILKEAQLEADIAEARLIANDETKDLAEQIDGINTAYEKTQQLFAARNGFAQTELSIMRRQAALGHNRTEDERALAQAAADVVNIRAQEDNSLRSLLRRQTTLNNAKKKQAELDRKAFEKDIEERLTRDEKAFESLQKLYDKQEIEEAKRIENASERADALVNIERVRLETLLEDESLTHNERLLAEEEFEDKKLKIYEETIDAKKEIDETANQIRVDNNEFMYSVLQDAASDNTVFGKGLAIADVLISTYQGIMKAIADLGVWGIPFGALIGAMGAKSIIDISGVMIPKAESGMMIKGNSHALGGELINAEGGEAIINKRSMADPFLRQLASNINVAGGGIPLMARGGIVGQGSNISMIGIEEEFTRALRKAPPVLVTEDLDKAQNRVIVTKQISTL